MKYLQAWLRRVAKSRHRDRLLLRGSLLTSQWVPGRPAADVDHVLEPSGDPMEARAIVDEVLALPDDEPLPAPVHEVIWAETPWPGHRTRLGDGDLQIDVGSGDPLAVPPQRVTILDIPLLAVRPEQMFGWKVHGLVELGHGQWKPKDLLDLWLIDQHCTLDDAAVTAAIRLAFTSRNYRLTDLDRFLYSTQWGRSRGSHRKWEAFRKRRLGTTPVPSLDVLADDVRVRITPLVEAAMRA